MSERLTTTENEALRYLYGGGDEEVVCWSAMWVNIQYKQRCLSLLHKGSRTLPEGTRMISERAKVEGRFGTCYTCEFCLRKASQDLNG